MIHILSNSEINKNRWDSCVEKSARPAVYGLSWFLDVVSPNWNGLILGDYEAVMPLCWRKKAGIAYLFQPAYCQFGGLFSDASQINYSKDIISELNKHFKLIEINLNPSNLPGDIGAKIQTKTNQILSLNKSLIKLDESIHKTHLKNIRRANRTGMVIKPISSNEYLLFKEGNKGNYPEKIAFLKGLALELERRNSIYCSGAFLDNKLITALLFVEYHNSRILISSETTTAGKDSKAMFSLIYELIKEKAGSNFILDFEGSSIPGVHDFNKGFGAIDENYFSVSINNLPWYMKLFKS